MGKQLLIQQNRLLADTDSSYCDEPTSALRKGALPSQEESSADRKGAGRCDLAMGELETSSGARPMAPVITQKKKTF